MIIRCIDVETTGLEASDRVVELGWFDLEVQGNEDLPDKIADRQITHGTSGSILFNPGIPIPPQASAIHHIVDDDVRYLREFVWADDDLSYIAAHNAAFEKMFVPTKRPWICTRKLALHMAPSAPAHDLQTLRYWTKLHVNPATASPPHRAAPDAYICAMLLERMLRKLTIAQMVELSQRPCLLAKFTFGKHAMVPLAEVPADYLQWIVQKGSEFDEDVLYTAKTHLDARREKAASRSPV